MAEPWTPPDQAHRERIATGLETSLLVEAGAGSGKTTAMVGRMIRLVRTGTATIDQLAAVTFTRKAAAELRERFQVTLEAAWREAGGAERERLSEALGAIDRCFVGTIHAFCGRLLRERPLEAGLAPNFEEVTGAEEERVMRESWSRFRERLAARESRLLGKLGELGLRPEQLRGAFLEVAGNADVHFPAPSAELPEPRELARVRRTLEALLAEARLLIPAEEPEKGWDPLQSKVRELDFLRVVTDWGRPVRLFEALEKALGTKNAVTLNRWSDDKAIQKQVKDLREAWDEFAGEGSEARRLVERWFAHRYRHVVRLARAAAGCWAADRIRLGKLSFQDLLLRAVHLLRTDASSRRELGRRYRFLLVDEFQDTDPVQAEILFLLASEDDAPWHEAVPRPGALFVVGDPKQSIYRFRRADIAVYNQVKARFRQFGAVVELTANFRSTAPIERIVNQVFDGPFPAEETEHQARFAPLRVRPGARAGAGVFWYRYEPAPGRGRYSGARLWEVESELLASWIEGRVRTEPGRRAGDFMVLTRTKHALSALARALEARNVPVQVSGSGVGVEEELSELVLLLRALGDPGDPVLTLAVLEGLFFGFSHEELYRHTRRGGRFSLLADDHPEGPVGDALRELRGWWLKARLFPADVAVGTIVERIGVLAYAAAGELGATRAGALVYALDALRQAGLDGRNSIAEAVEVLETALEQEVEAPLVPGTEDAVRLMNLHKAKGLEAPVVVLAYPASPPDHPPRRHVRRGADGRARGYLCVTDATRRTQPPVIARPLDWAEHEAAERPFQEAEEVRLLYVAATRAGSELVVARCTGTEEASCWRAFHEALDAPGVAGELPLVPAPRPAREALTESAEALRARVAALAEARRAVSAPTYRLGSVTRRVEADAARSASGSAPAGGGGGGAEWGSVVHRAIEAAGRGLQGDAFRSACRSYLVEAELETDARGEPARLDELVGLVERLRESALWERALRAELLLVEAPFCLALPAAEARALGAVPAAEADAGAIELVEGVIDLVFREAGGAWVVCDYKTDRFPTPELRAARLAGYRRQVDLYAECWRRMTGQPVAERVLVLLGEGTEEVW